MPRSLTSAIAQHPRRSLLGALAFLLVAIVLGGPIFGALEDGDGFTASDAESARAYARKRNWSPPLAGCRARASCWGP